MAAALKVSGCGWALKLDDVARTIIELSSLAHRTGGVDRLFEGTAPEILWRFKSIYGVGDGIANMILIQRVRFFGLRPAGLEVLTVKADTHVVRVFHRAGLSQAPTESAALVAAASWTINERIAADQAAWVVGKDFCHPAGPECKLCFLDTSCPKVGL